MRNLTIAAVALGSLALASTANAGGQAVPALTINAEPAQTTVGNQLRAIATLTGGVNDPTGVITFNLYPPGDPTCAGPPADTSVTAVNGNASYPSDTTPATTTGTYRWTASYSGDPNNQSVSTACGAPNSFAAVSAAPPVQPGSTPTPTPVVVAPPTGQRAAAVNRCKKKFRKGTKARKKCLRRARLLPV